MDFVKTYLEKYLFKHDNKGHKNLTWGSLVDEQGSEETENPAEHPWNLAVSSVQPKTSSVPDKKAQSVWEVDFMWEKQLLLPSHTENAVTPSLGQAHSGGVHDWGSIVREASGWKHGSGTQALPASTALSKVFIQVLPTDQLWLL